jgi:hypothetical protein
LLAEVGEPSSQDRARARALARRIAAQRTPRAS